MKHEMGKKSKKVHQGANLGRRSPGDTPQVPIAAVESGLFCGSDLLYETINRDVHSDLNSDVNSGVTRGSNASGI